VIRVKLNQSVATRLFVGFGAVIAVFGVAVTLSIVRLADFNASVATVTGPELAKLEMIDAWALNISESMRHTRNMLILDDKSKIQTEVDAVKATFDKRKEYAEALTAGMTSADGKSLMRAVLEGREINIPLEHEYLQQIEAGQFKDAKETLLQRARPAQLALMASLTKLRDYQKAQIKDAADALAASYQRVRTLLLLLSLAAVLVGSVLAYLIVRAIRNPLRQAVAVLAEIEKGNYATLVTVSSADETGQVLAALDAMQRSLEERTERDRSAAVENGRIRTALDRVSAGTMLADADGKIIYMNDAVRGMFRAVAIEVRKQLPKFDPEQVVGQSFDIFHRSPAHQRNLLASLTSQHTADVKLGGASLRIVANPVLDSDGKRAGTVVQWFDRTQEVTAEEEVQAMVAQAIEGNLTSRIREDGKDGFFKVLAGGMNRLVDNMAEVVRAMTAAAAEVRVGADEISRGNTNLSQRTEEQAASLEETASSMEEMTSTVKSNADNASQASQLAQAARQQAERGGSVVQSAVAAMSAINASSKRIADIIGVIDEIAFQTNLLALNAAVEAARAGEQGRGFAVVASEVRNLASRSAEAAKEIKALIQDSVGKVADGSRLVDESGKVLSEIVVGVKKVTDVVAEIAASSQEQASGIDQVNKAVVSMDEVTQQNAALVEEASAAAQALTEQAAMLTQLMARYQVGGTDAAPAPRPVARPTTAVTPSTERRTTKRPWSGAGAKATASAAVPTAPARKAAGGDAGGLWNEF
jgi:methyl-accepting chemotaxis protein